MCHGYDDAVVESSSVLSESGSRVIAVLVAFNRRDLLIEALTALGAQERRLDGILVIDNASTDDTAQVASEHAAQPKVLTLAENTGGAGGFAAGIAYALESMDADYLWLMDDDTIPMPSALRELLRVCDAYPGDVDVAGSKVVWTDGRDHPMNTPRRRPIVSKAKLDAADSVGSVPVRSSSFVSMLIRADAAREQGLPVADYFIWNDDFEYSCRLLRRGVGLHVPASVVEHRTKTFGATDADPGERFYFEVRNKIWLLTRSVALSPGERVLYTGSTLRRWVRTFRRSQARDVLWSAARRGLADGIRKRPRPTTEVLADLPAVAADVRITELGSR